MSGADGNGGNRNGDTDAEAMKSLGAAANEAAASVQKLGSAEEERTKKAILAAAASVSGAQATRDNAKALEEWNRVGQLSKQVLEDYIKSLDKEKEKSEKNEPYKATAEAAKKVAEFGESLAKAADEIEKFDPKLAENVRSFSRLTVEAGNAVAAIATGFASGGPVGAALAAATQAVTILGNEWIASAKKEEEANRKITEGLERVAEKRRAAARAQGEATAKNYLSYLHSQADAIRDQNEALSRNVELNREKHRAEVELIDARASLELARIDHDPTLSESEKISRRAEVDKGIIRLKAQEDSRAQGYRQEDAQRAADGKMAEIGQNIENTKALMEELDNQKKKYAEASGQLDNIKRNKIAIPVIEKRIEDLATARGAEGIGSQGMFSKDRMDYYNSTSKQLNAELDETIEGARDRPDLQKAKEDADKEVEELKVGIANLQKEIIGQGKEANKLNDIARQTADTVKYTQARIKDRLDVDLERHKIETDSKVGNARFQEKKEQVTESGFAKTAAQTASALAGDNRLTSGLRTDAAAAAKRLEGSNPSVGDFKLVERIISIISDRVANDAKRAAEVKALDRQVRDLETKFKAERGRGNR